MKPIFFLFTFFLLSGCSANNPPFRASVDSIGEVTEFKRRYVLMPGDKDISPEDLQFKEYATYVNHALWKQGFSPASSLEDANVVIFLMYGIGDPQEHQYSYSIPTWGQTGVASSYTSGSFRGFGGYGSYSGTTTYTPIYGVTGSQTYSGNYTTYFRFLILEAIDLDEYKRSEREIQLWKTTVTSSGSSEDLRRVFPILVAASQEYIGKNTGRKVEVSLYETDKRVVEIKGIAGSDRRTE